MTPKEKAREIVNKYIDLSDECDCLEYRCICFTMYEYKAKQCALIAIDEMIELCESYVAPYYYEVKKEIENL